MNCPSCGVPMVNTPIACTIANTTITVHGGCSACYQRITEAKQAIAARAETWAALRGDDSWPRADIFSQ